MHGTVLATTRLTPSMIRVVLHGDGLANFTMPDATDAYVNIAVPPDDAPYAGRFEVAEVRDSHPQELWPVRRRYTVRRWQPDERLLTLDFVVHGDDGIAGPWAALARPGDTLVFEGPAGGYRPDPEADWHLMVGDESALPAIAASLEALPGGAQAVVRLVVDGPEHELDLSTDADLDVLWLHRSGGCADPELLPAAIRGLHWRPGRVQAFVHGEATEIRAIRRHLLADRGVVRSDLSCSPYWRRTMTDETWREVKRDFVAAMDRDVA